VSSFASSSFDDLLIISVMPTVAHTIAVEFHGSAARAEINFEGPSPAHSQDTAAPTSRPKRRVYALCPPKFHRVGTDCYSLVDQRSSWLEAHFFCKDKNANLTEPGKHADRKLRLFLQKQDALSGGE